MTFCLTLRNYKIEVAIIPERQRHLGGVFWWGYLLFFDLSISYFTLGNEEGRKGWLVDGWMDGNMTFLLDATHLVLLEILGILMMGWAVSKYTYLPG